MFMASMGALQQYSAPAGDEYACAVDYYTITREFIRSGIDLNDALSKLIYVPGLLKGQEQPFVEEPSKRLLDWAAFLRDQGLIVDLLGVGGYSVCTPYLVLQGNSERDIRRLTNAVFILCLLGADVSIREPRSGMQALHRLFLNPWSAELSSHVINLAYILVHFGGADVHAVNYDNSSPTIYAFNSGWLDEWEIVLDRCGFDPNEELIKAFESWNKSCFLGNGESTAIDTEDLSIPKFDSLPRRRRCCGC